MIRRRLLVLPRHDYHSFHYYRWFSSSEIKTLVVSNIVPDSSASAAGVRTQALLTSLAQDFPVHLVTSVSTSTSVPKPEKSTVSAAKARDVIEEILALRNISWSHLPPNRSDQLREFCRQHSKVTTILFDRFYNEEAYSFAFKEYYPDATLVLDMQDMHSLRGGRESIVHHWDSRHTGGDPFQVLDQVMTYIPSIEEPQFLRELASIHRSDLTLVCSPYELSLLQSVYGISSSKLCLAPFFVPIKQVHEAPIPASSTPSFVFCGGFKHAPNLDAVRILLRHIWPRIRTHLPTATLHIHGAYCPIEFQQAHSPKEHGIHVHGYTPSLDQVFLDRQGGVLLAPLRFGAGIKGKIIDAWTYGMPVVTTPVGSEGLIGYGQGELSSFGGGVAWTLEDFVEMAVEHAVSSDTRHQATKSGQELLRKNQNGTTNGERVKASLNETTTNLQVKRRHDYTRALLWHQFTRSTEYFSRWIELKESMANVTRK